MAQVLDTVMDMVVDTVLDLDRTMAMGQVRA
jgi:hypothetical protein